MKNIKNIALLGCILGTATSFGMMQKLPVMLKKSDTQALGQQELNQLGRMAHNSQSIPQAKKKIEYILDLDMPRQDQIELAEVLISWLHPRPPSDQYQKRLAKLKKSLPKVPKAPPAPPVTRVPKAVPPITPAALQAAKENLKDAKDMLKTLEDMRAAQLAGLQAQEMYRSTADGIADLKLKIKELELGNDAEKQQAQELKKELKQLENRLQIVKKKLPKRPLPKPGDAANLSKKAREKKKAAMDSVKDLEALSDKSGKELAAKEKEVQEKDEKARDSIADFDAIVNELIAFGQEEEAKEIEDEFEQYEKMFEEARAKIQTVAPRVLREMESGDRKPVTVPAASRVPIGEVGIKKAEDDIKALKDKIRQYDVATSPAEGQQILAKLKTDFEMLQKDMNKKVVPATGPQALKDRKAAIDSELNNVEAQVREIEERAARLQPGVAIARTMGLPQAKKAVVKEVSEFEKAVAELRDQPANPKLISEAKEQYKEAGDAVLDNLDKLYEELEKEGVTPDPRRSQQLLQDQAELENQLKEIEDLEEEFRQLVPGAIPPAPPAPPLPQPGVVGKKLPTAQRPAGDLSGGPEVKDIVGKKQTQAQKEQVELLKDVFKKKFKGMEEDEDEE